jgi:hypothetical protein
MLNALLVGCLLLSPEAAPQTPTTQSGLTNGAFEVLKDGLPVDWSPVVTEPANSYGISPDARSGRCSLRLVRKADKGELGFNREWAPDSGRGGAMLAQTRGGLVFWYKIISLSADGEMEFMAIPMSARPYEEGAAQRVICSVPREHAGDGQWHKAVLKYDYSGDAKVKWVHAAGRLNRGTGEVLVDDAAYLPKIGPLIELSKTKVEVIGPAQDERFRVSCIATNRGDEPTRRLATSLSIPQGYLITSATYAGQTEPIPVDQQREVSWELRGHRANGDRLTVSVEGAAEAVRQVIELKPRLEVRLVPTESLLLGDTTVKLAAHIENSGTACARDVRWLVGVSPSEILKMTGPLSLWRTVPVFLPGQIERPTWQVSPRMVGSAANVSITVRSADAGTIRHEQEFVSLGGLGDPRPDDVRWQSRGTELVFHGSPMGYGAFSVYTGGEEGDRKLVARVPRAGRIVVAQAKGADETIDFYGDLTPSADQVRIVAQAVDKAGATWTLTVGFKPSRVRNSVDLRYELTCDRDGLIRAFEGPVLWAGEGSFGREKRDAIVPGIEWLWGDEASSNDLDFQPGHAHRVRYVPHPNELTWPILSIAGGGAGVGLMWNPLQRFDGQRFGPQPIFASPDWVTNRNHHLMGLMLPTVREMKKRNVRLAPEPMAFKAGRAWTMAATLWADGDVRDSLQALDAWMDARSLPEPLKPPRGDWPKEISFSMSAYLQTLYDPKADGWRSTVGGPGAFQGPPGRHANFGLDVWMGSHLADDAAVRRQCAEMVERMFAKRNEPVGSDDLGYIMGRPDRMLVHLAGAAGSLIHNQGPDGAWRFDADLKDPGLFKGFDYHELGPDKAAELGTCARKAYEILSLARLTGDQRAQRAGLTALEFMTRFEIPRAAQVWEVPVHSPDILAAADAIDAYLEAYLIDGNEDHLKQAVRWARAGLPFVYIWHVPECPWMQYGSIAVYGASWKKYSWIANPVQWNGLRYAYALIRLARHDKSRPWLRAAQGITVSAMYQQNPDGRLKALWPDSIRVDEPGRSNWEFSPQQILKNVYALTGRDEVPTSHIAEGFILSTVGSFRQVNRTGSDLDVEVEIPHPLTSWLLVAQTSPPAAVRLDGRTIQPLAIETSRLVTPGWIYRPEISLLMVGLPAPGVHRVVVDGIDPAPAEWVPSLRETIRFEFGRGMGGWQPASHLADWKIQDERLTLRTTGGDSYLIRPSLRVPPRSVGTVTIRMQVDRGGSGQFFWATSDSPAIDEAKSISFPLQPGSMCTYRLRVGRHPRWTGEYITAIRLDPTDVPRATVVIDSIQGE